MCVVFRASRIVTRRHRAAQAIHLPSPLHSNVTHAPVLRRHLPITQRPLSSVTVIAPRNHRACWVAKGTRGMFRGIGGGLVEIRSRSILLSGGPCCAARPLQNR